VESADRRSKIAQIFLPWSKANDVLTELRGGPSGIHLGVNETLNKVRQKYYWLQARGDVEKCDTCAAGCGPRTRNRGQMHQYNVGAPLERKTINVAESFPRRDQGNRYLLIAMDYFTKWPESYAIPNQDASTVAEAMVTNFCRFAVPR
jgi:hypothetical protein